MIIRLYLSFLQIYIDDNKNFDKSLFNVWSNEMKPYIIKNYPIALKNIFNSNSDIHFLVDLIEQLKEKYKNKNKEEEIKIIKGEENRNENKNNSINNKKVQEKKLMKSMQQKKENDFNNNIKIEKNNNMKKSPINEEEDIKILRKKNLPKIKKFLEEFIQQKKRPNSMKNLRPYSKTIASATTCDDSEDIDDSNLNINQIINDNDIKESKSKNNNNFIMKDVLVNKNNNIEEEFEFKRNNVRSMTIKILVEMTPYYKEEEGEIEGINILYKQPENKIQYILTDLLLKKIIFENFINNNVLLIYHFCKQCFCFVNKDIFFKKIFHCYNYYKSKKTSLNYLKNLIQFINILVIEMFEYYQKIDYNEGHISLIRKFYFQLISDLISNFKEDESGIKEKEIKNDDSKENDNNFFRFDSFDLKNYKVKTKNSNNYNYTLNRKNLIKMDLNFEIKNINIFILKEKENSLLNKENLKKEKTNYNKKNMNNNKNLFSFNIRNSISFKNKELRKDKLEEGKDDEKYEKEILKKEEEAKTDNLLRISRALRKSQIIQLENTIKDLIIEEEKSDEDENSNENSFLEEIKVKNKEKEQKEQKEQKEKLIQNLLENIFTSNKNKIISIKEEILKQIKNILLLIDINEEEPSFNDIKNAKENLPFYYKLNKLRTKNNNSNIIINQKRTSYSFFNLGTISFKQINDRKDYLKKGYFCITDWKDEEIGDKLTFVTKSLLNKINLKEIYRGAFIKKDNAITCPNIAKCINNFNKLTAFIQEDVLSYNTPNKRAKIFEKWIQVADYCKTNRNYSDCLAIYSALNNYLIVNKLKLTIKALSPKAKSLFEQIGKFSSCIGNYKKVREEMNLCERNGKTFIPYLGMLLRDINFIEESSKYINEKGCINIEKIEKINSTIEKYFRYQTNENDINKKYKNIPELNFLENLEVSSEEDLEKLAEKIEPVFKLDKSEDKRYTIIDKKYFEKYKPNKPNMKIKGISMRSQSVSFNYI